MEQHRKALKVPGQRPCLALCLLYHSENHLYWEKLTFSSRSLPSSIKERWIKGFPQNAQPGLSQAGRHFFRHTNVAWIATRCTMRQDREKINYLNSRGNTKIVSSASVSVVLSIHRSHSTLQRGGEIIPHGSLITVTASALPLPWNHRGVAVLVTSKLLRRCQPQFIEYSTTIDWVV